MMVVTSPMGDQAPPVLAAMTTILAYIQRSRCSLMSLRSSMTMTMVVVRLSSTADRKNAMMQIIHNSLRFWRVVIRSVMMENPPCTSMSSTMVMAPTRKKRVEDISPMCSIIFTLRINSRHCRASDSCCREAEEAAMNSFSSSPLMAGTIVSAPKA